MKYVLKSFDGVCFEVDQATAFQSTTVAHWFEEVNDGLPLTLPVRSDIVIEYCRKVAKRHSSLSCERFIKIKIRDDKSTLFDLTNAANHLAVHSLVDLTCQIIADMIANKTPAQIRAFFNIIGNDFNPDE